jgi:hypothetical protein
LIKIKSYGPNSGEPIDKKIKIRLMQRRIGAGRGPDRMNTREISRRELILDFRLK